MPSPELPYIFDINFSFARDSIFSEVRNDDGSIFPPPVSGTFTLLDGDNFSLLSGEDFVLL